MGFGKRQGFFRFLLQKQAKVDRINPVVAIMSHEIAHAHTIFCCVFRYRLNEQCCFLVSRSIENCLSVSAKDYE